MRTAPFQPRTRYEIARIGELKGERADQRNPQSDASTAQGVFTISCRLRELDTVRRSCRRLILRQDNMKLQFAFLADFALAHPDGKLYVLGGGFDTVYVPDLPVRHPHLALVLSLRFDASECGRSYVIEIHPKDGRGASFFPTATVQANPQRNPQAPTLAVAFHSVVNFQGVPLKVPGEHLFSLLVDGRELAAIPLRVIGVDGPKLTGGRPN